MLSLLLTIKGATQKEVMELCSYTDPVGQPGQDVWVVASVYGPIRGRKARGKLVSVDVANGMCVVDVEHKSAEGVGAQQHRVALHLVKSTKTVVCTFHQIRAAMNHAAVRYPGAPVPQMVRVLERLDLARAKYLADWLAHDQVSEHVEASGRNLQREGTCLVPVSLLLSHVLARRSAPLFPL